MENKKMTLAIITARGGSKRIPRKNIKEFCGKPIVAYSIEAAKQAEVFDEIMVSTDDEEIAEVGRKFGAVVPFFRSPETSNDFATTADVLEEVLKEYEKQANNSQMFSANDSFCEGCCKDLCCLAMCNCCLDSLCNRY